MAQPIALIRVVDLETTGFAPPEHAPVEIGWCDVIAHGRDLAGAPTDWRICHLWSDLLAPGRRIPPEASAIHHIVDDDVGAARDWPGGIADACVAPPGAMAIGAFAAHSATMERQWITDDLTGGAPWICTWKCALRAWPEAPAHSNQALRYWRAPMGLDRAMAMPAHRAGPDAYVTAHLLRDLLDLAPVETLIEWSAEPGLLIRVPFGRYTRGMLWRDVDDDFLDWVLARDFSADVLFTARHERDRRAKEAEAAGREEPAS